MSDVGAVYFSSFSSSSSASRRRPRGTPGRRIRTRRICRGTPGTDRSTHRRSAPHRFLVVTELLPRDHLQQLLQRAEPAGHRRERVRPFAMAALRSCMSRTASPPRRTRRTPPRARARWGSRPDGPTARVRRRTPRPSDRRSRRRTRGGWIATPATRRGRWRREGTAFVLEPQYTRTPTDSNTLGAAASGDDAAAIEGVKA